MAPAMGFWRFMDDVHDMVFSGEPIDWHNNWHNTPVIDPVVPKPTGFQEDASQPTEALSPAKGSLATVNTDTLLEDLNNQNKELLQERKNALRWQDTASMAVKEAKDHAETRKQEAKAAKKAGLQAAAKLQQQLVGYINQVAALKRGETRAGLEKNRAEAEHREEISVVERKIKELQAGLVSAIRHGRGSIALFDELSRISQDMLNELVAKDRKLATIRKEKEDLQERINARSSVFEDMREEARKNREAYHTSCREKGKSERAQRAAERKVGELEREAVRVKAVTDKSIKALETKLAESVARETGANTRVIKAEGDVEQLRRELDNTELARQNFEKKEGDWAALFAGTQTPATTQSALNDPNARGLGTDWQVPSATITVVEVSRPSERSSEENSREDWRRDIHRELVEQNQTILATEREKIRHELDEEKRKAVATERRLNRGNVQSSLKALLVMKLKSQKNKELRKVRQRAAIKRVKAKKGQVNWDFVEVVSQTTEVDRSQLEAQIRGQLQNEFQSALANHKTECNNKHICEQSQLETQIRSQLQSELQNQLASHKTKWEGEHAAIERPRLETEIRTRLETEIRTQLETEFRNGLDEQKIQWQTEFVDSERPVLEAKIRADVEDEYQNYAASAATRFPEDEMLLASLSLESDEAHALFQEIGRSGIPHGSVGYTVLQGLNRAKDALHIIKCELQKPDAVADKNNLLHAVKGVHINTHYIEKLSVNTREVLIHQAIEANRRLEYVKNTLGTKEDVAKDAMLKYLLEPLKTECEHKDIPEYPQIANSFGNVATIGNSTFPQTFNSVRNQAAPSTTTFAAVNDSANLAAPGTSTFPPIVNSFGNVATSGTSGTHQKPSLSSDPKTHDGFGDGTTLGVTRTSREGVFNPFEGSHFGNQPSLDSTPSQKDQDSGRSDRTTDTNRNGQTHFKKTFQPLLPQGEGPAPPIGMNPAASATPTFNFADLSSTSRTDSSDKNHQMDTDGNKTPLSAPQDHSGVIGVAISPARSRQAKTSQGQQRRPAPKDRQLAHQAFAKKPDTLTSMPFQTQQPKRQEQVPATQPFGSSGFPRTAFTLEPNHAFDLTPSSSLADRGTHLRVQQDPGEYQKPLKIFQIPEGVAPAPEHGENIATSSESMSMDQSWPSEIMPSQAEYVTPETPPGCGGWTSEMEKYAQNFLKDTDIERFQLELESLYPSTKHMPGLLPYLQKLKQDMEAAEPDQVQSERKSEQPAGWTTQMTEFVEGSLCGGNDVDATVNLFRKEIVDAFDIQGLTEHVEKLKNELVRKNNPLAYQHQVSPAPLGWNDGMTAIVQKYLRDGGRDVEFMVQSLEITEPNAVFCTGLHEYVTALMLKFQTQGVR